VSVIAGGCLVSAGRLCLNRIRPLLQCRATMLNARAVRWLLRVVESPLVVFPVALGLRLWMLTQLLPAKAGPYFYQYNEFARIASALATGHGYSSPWPGTPLAPTAQQPPVYAFLLAGIFRLAGPYSYASLWIAVGLNAVLSAITAVLILRLGTRDFGRTTGVLAAWTWACWLYEAAVGVRLWESSLSALLLTLALFWLPALGASNRMSRWLWFGALAGVAVLTNTTLLAVFPFFWIWLWLVHQPDRQSCSKFLLASVMMFMLTLGPWTLRNYFAFHRLVPVRDNFGLELWLGNHEGVTNRFDNDFPVLDPSEYNRLGEVPFMQAKGQIALQFIGEHPGRFFALSLRRFFRYWTAPDPWIWLPLSLLAWVGMFLGLRKRGTVAVPYAIVLLVFPVVYYVTHVFSYYRHPAEPAMFILAAFAVRVALQQVAGREGSELTG
jgi:Dolichyl-phosphate-mannose-protein mannosyltransferase